MKSLKEALVSIIIPCYNGSKYVDTCFSSILNQDYDNVEIIVVDDGSQDNSAEKIKSWNDKFNSKGWLLTYVHQNNQGPGAAINTGLKYVNGDYLSLLDIDDRFLPGSIKKRAEFLTYNNEYAGVKTNGWMVKGETKNLFVTEESEKQINDLFDALIRGRTNNWAGSYMVRTSILFDFYPDREIYPSRFGQNLQIIMPVAYRRKFGYIDEPLMEYIIHEESLSQSKANKFEKDEANSEGYKDIYIHVINRIVHDKTELKIYCDVIDACFCRSAMLRAIAYDKKMNAVKNFKELKRKGFCTLSDYISFYNYSCPAIGILFRLVRKMLTYYGTWRNKYEELINEVQYGIQSLIYLPPDIVDRVETSKLLAESNSMSLVRYGDGELGQIINHQDIGFQKYDQDLAKRLHEIILSENDSNILICIPDVFGRNINRMRKEPKAYWKQWLIANSLKLEPILSKKRIYGDSLVTRLYLPWEDKSNEHKIIRNLKKTWTDKKVVIVEGEKTCWGVGNDLLDEAKSVKRILCPAENAYEKYREILSKCMEYKNETDIFILAIGPTATVLAYDLAKLGTRALDLGHFDLQYEYLIHKYDSRVKIQGKYNNELNDTNVEMIYDETYMQSIVSRISNISG